MTTDYQLYQAAFQMGQGLEGGLDAGIFYEILIRRLYERILKPGDFALDLGAHKGLHTFPMARSVGKSGIVVAFEALPDLCACLKQYALRHQLDNITFIEKAASCKSGSSSFYDVVHGRGISSLEKPILGNDLKWLVDTSISIRVDLARVEDEISHISRPLRFVKADIEGAELHAFQGFEARLESDKPVIIFENSRDVAAAQYGYTPSDFFDFFDRASYKLYDILGREFQRDNWGEPRPFYFIAAGANCDQLIIEKHLEPILRSIVDTPSDKLSSWYADQEMA